MQGLSSIKNQLSFVSRMTLTIVLMIWLNTQGCPIFDFAVPAAIKVRNPQGEELHGAGCRECCGHYRKGALCNVL